MLVTRKNPPVQKSIVKSINTSEATLNKIMNQDSQLKKAKNIMFTSSCQDMRTNAKHFVEPRGKTV